MKLRKQKLRKVTSTIISAAMAGTLLAGCGGDKAPAQNASDQNASDTGTSGDAKDSAGTVQAGSPDLSEHITLTFYLYGSPGAANEDILKEINTKLTADINTSVEVKYIDWGDINTKYPLLWASGEEFDMAYASINTAVPFTRWQNRGLCTISPESWTAVRLC